ncbi:MAG: hypothetical protein CMM81_01470, partial [Rhodospirillales bacterium]|nr:hypothetical protein [Rhodospirillales bacterium]
MDEDDLAIADGDLVDGTDAANTAADQISQGTLPVNVNFGADGPAAANALVFSTGTPSAMTALGVTSDGEALTYALSNNGTVLTASTSEGTVFTVTLVPTGVSGTVGNYNIEFDLVGTVDHPTAGEQDVLSYVNGSGQGVLTLVVTDGDGSTANASFAIGIRDDVPQITLESGSIVQSTSVAVSEDDLPDGSDQSDSLSASADLGLSGGVLATIDYGADGPAAGAPATLSYEDFDFAIVGPTGLTSQGDAITYSQTGDVLTATADGRDVFTVTVNSDGTYTFELKDTIDHDAGDSYNSETLTFTINGTPNAATQAAAIDGDGDPATGIDGVLVTQSFNVGIADDVPVAEVAHTTNPSELAGTVDEDDLNDGTDQSDSPSVSGSIGFDAGDLITIDYGADGPAAGSPTGLGFDDMDFTIEGPVGLTSQGEEITYSYDETTDTLTGTADGRDVFTVSLDGSGGFTFNLLDSIDHQDGSGQNITELGFRVTGEPNAAALASTDYDQDAVSNLDGMTVTQEFRVAVVDDVPQVQNNQDAVGAAVTGAVDEDDLTDGTDATKESLTTGGDMGLAGGRDLVTIDYGADGAADNAPTALQYDDMDWVVTGPAGLTSGGEAITYNDPAGDVLTATAGGRDIFTVTLNSDGSYTFELLDQIDHETADGQNVEALSFSVTGTPSADAIADIADYDQDAANGLASQQITQTLAVDVTDDVPVAIVTDTVVAADTVSLDEDDLGNGSDGTGPASASGSLGLAGHALYTIDLGADAAGSTGPTSLNYDDFDYTITGPTDLTSNGQPIVFTQSGDTLTGVAGGNDVMTVTLNADGTYTVALLDQIDHPTGAGENTQNLSFSLSGTVKDGVEILDGDGDPVDLSNVTVSKGFAVEIVDDVPVALDDDGGQTKVDGTLSGNVLTNDTVGADDDGATLEVTSFTYTDENGATQTGTIGEAADTQYGSFTLNSDGSWTFDPSDSVDFAGGTSLTEGITYTITDDDGDTDSAVLDLTVVSGPGVTVNLPPSGDPNLGANGAFVDEDDLTAAQGDSDVGTDGTGSSAVSGTIDIDVGNAGFGSLTIAGSAALDAMTLSSDGVGLVYTSDGDVLTATAGAGGPTVFTVSITGDESSGFGWTFDLVGNLDHPDGAGQNVINNLPFTVTLTDGDGTAVSDIIQVDVVDDVPVLAMGDAPSLATAVTVDEDDATGGTDGADSSSATGDLGLIGKDLFTVDTGADSDSATGGTTLTYGDFDYTISGPTDLTSNGVAITYNQVGDVLTASAGSETVFTVTLNSDGTYTFDLQGNIDHDTAQGENQTDLTFSLSGTVKDGVEIVDGDGDAVDLSSATVSQTFGVTVVDDVPVATVNNDAIGTATTATVNEDDLSGGNDIIAGVDSQTVDVADGDGNDLVSSGDLGLAGRDLVSINYGADGPAAGAPTALQYDDFTYTITGPTGLTSQGEEITYSQTGDVLTATADGREVFTVTLDGNGGYTFELKDTLDHAPGNGQNTQNLQFSLSGVPNADALALTDYDGDAVEGLSGATVTQSFSVDVTDDIPVANSDPLVFATEGGAEVGGNLLANDSFGADSAGGKVTAFSYTDVNGDSATAPAGSTVDTQYGQLNVQADGTWSYTPNEDADHTATGGAALNDNFSYTIVDGDGDTATADQPIRVRDDKPTITINPPPSGDPNVDVNGAFVDEDDLTAAQGDTAIGSDGTGSSAVSGTLTIDGGQDGISGVALSIPTELTDMGLKSGGVPLTYSTDGQTITAMAGTVTVFTVALTGNATDGYGWTFDLKDNLDHPTATAEDVINNIPFTVTVTDNDGSQASATLEVDVIDDVPTARDDGEYRVQQAGGTTDSTVTGNLLTDNDTVGADSEGAAVVSITYTPEGGGAAVSAVVDPVNGVTVDTESGTLTVNADGTWSYTADDDVQNVGGADVHDDFTYTLQDGDGDQSTANVSVSIGDDGPEISFPTDDGPQAVGDGLVDEANLGLESGDTVTGSDPTPDSSVTRPITVDFGQDGPAASDALVLEIPPALENMGLTSNGVTLTYALSTDGSTITALAGTEAVFTMSLSGNPTDGYSYQFDLLGNLDHASGQGTNLIEDIPFTLVATDGDGTVTKGDIKIDVQDDVPDAKDDGEYRLDQAGDSIGNSVTGNLLTDNDTVGADSDGATITAITYTPEGGGAMVSAVVDPVNGVTVDTQYGELTVGPDGSWSYTADTDIVNVSGQDVEDDFTYTLQDRDGDTDTATVHLVVGDDGPEISFPTDDGPQVTGDGLVDEAALGGEAGDVTTGSVGTGASSVTRPVAIDFGEDGPAATNPVVLEIPQALEDRGLTSNGEGLTYTLSTDGSTITAVTDPSGTPVFTMTLSGNPTDGYSYQFDLQGNLDHAPGQSDNLIEDIPFAVVVTDGDGSVTSGLINIDVRDDVPDAIDDGEYRLQQAGETVDNTVTGNLLTENDVTGADAAKSSITEISYTPEGGGAAVSALVDPINGVTVDTENGTLTVNADGSWSYTADSDVQNVGGADVSDDFTYTLTDGDGDSDTATVHLVIGDDGPEISFPTDEGPQAIGSGLVDEDDLSMDAGDSVDGSDGSSASSITRPVDIDFGEDGPATTDPVQLEITPELTNFGLKSGGETVTYTLSNDGMTITGSANGATVLTMSLSGNATDGFGYTFDLVGPLDHAQGQAENLIENIPFGLVATDGDGSVAKGSIEIDVRDDVPNAVDDGTVVAQEGGDAVTGNVLTNDSAGADGITLTGFTYNDAAGTPQSAAAGTTVKTEFGTLTVNSDGSWTYQADSDIPNNEATNVADGFTYTIVDGDGDTDFAS